MWYFTLFTFVCTYIYIVEDELVSVRFEGSDKQYSIAWSELLVPETELPFEDLQQLTDGTVVLAPYQYTDSEAVKHSLATVCLKGNGHCKSTIIFVPCLDKFCYLQLLQRK